VYPTSWRPAPKFYSSSIRFWDDAYAETRRNSVTVRDVAELLGDTEDVIVKFYGAWVFERQERLCRVLQEAFAEEPKPKIVAITRSLSKSSVR
jgi:hypothetical protein